MKIMKTTIVVMLVFGAISHMQAQDSVESLQTKIELNGEALDKEIKINVDQNSRTIQIRVEGRVSGGKVSIKLTDPSGETISKLNLTAKEGSSAKGWLEEATDAEPGDWKVQILNDQATGQVMLQVRQNKGI